MPRGRWFVIGFLLAASLATGVLNARGPFDAHPSLPYAVFLADFQAGHVERIVQWRDRLEVDESGQLRAVTVPPDRDLGADLAAARRAGGVGIDLEGIPEDWLGLTTPWNPILILTAVAVIWTAGVARERRSGSRSPSTGSPRPAT